MTSYAIPPSGIGHSLQFTDIAVGSDRLYVINDQRSCEFVFSGGVPLFQSPSFCAAHAPGWVLRGFVMHRGAAHVLDVAGGRIASQTGAIQTLPGQILDPQGLTSDGANLWVAGGLAGAVWKLPAAGAAEKLALAAVSIDGITWDGTHLWALDTDTISVITPTGMLVATLSVGQPLSGIAISTTTKTVWATAANASILYSFALPNLA